MNRRAFLSNGGALALATALAPRGWCLLTEAQPQSAEPNTNWADAKLGAKATASSWVTDPPSGYRPSHVLNNRLRIAWQANNEAVGAWIEVGFDKPEPVRELWFLATAQQSGVLGEDPYTMEFSREPLLMAPRELNVRVSSGAVYKVELRQAGYFQILTLPKTEVTSVLHITVTGVWSKPGGRETGLGKVQAYPREHDLAFEIVAQRMYDVQAGKPVQRATLTLVNPGEETRGSELRVSGAGFATAAIALQPTPAHAVFQHEIWIPAPFEDTEMTFELVSPGVARRCQRTLHVPPYQSYFDGGTFELDCTNHNDMGWLSTQTLTADYRSKALILPALELMRKYPEFVYSMECTAYLMEFLERHPELRDEMTARMREGRFTWGASYVQLLEISAGPEKLVRQFYFGRRWLKKTFPGVDTRFYIQTDPPSLSLQMPQLLARAGVQYCLLGRMTYGYFNWQSPDGTALLVYGYRYVDGGTLLDPTDSRGWLRFADEREAYYAAHQLPRKFAYDYTSDYLPPQPGIVPYARRENQRMEQFAAAWNEHYAADANRQIHPPRIQFTTPEKYLDELTRQPIDIPTLRGEWPHAWAYYDEPSNREALLDGRHAHNDLLAAERLYAALGVAGGFADYPAAEFEEAWRANVWPDHGWGGNRGLEGDQVFANSYAKSRVLAARLLSRAGSKLAARLPQPAASQIAIVVYNSLSWPRTDVVECVVKVPADWRGSTIEDEHGAAVPFEVLENTAGMPRIAFVAHDVPAVGSRRYLLKRGEPSNDGATSLDGRTIENRFFRLEFGASGIQSLFDKRQGVEMLRTDKFQGGEILQFSAPGQAWEESEAVSLEDFDRTANHEFRFAGLRRTPIRITAIREASFAHFKLRQHVHLYHELDRVEIETAILNWDGTKSLELRTAFPLALDVARLSYEVPFGTVEIGKDEIDYSRLPSNAASQFYPQKYGGNRPLAFREAINWIDAASPNYGSFGMLAASDATVHLFRDQSGQPVEYPVLQHVLLSTRKSLAWNPEYWTTQKGDHRYRMALLPHAGDWRQRYREAIGFNYRLAAFVREGEGGSASTGPEPTLRLEPHNLVLSAMKKSEDDERVVLRFYEAEGDKSTARIRLSRPVRKAWRTNLIEEDESELQPLADGSLVFPVGAWEIVTIKVSV